MNDKGFGSEKRIASEIADYTKATEAEAQAETEITARYELFFTAQQAVRETYEAEVLAPRQAVWEDFTNALSAEPALSWQRVDELWDKDGSGRAPGDIRVMWEFERIENDDKGDAHAFSTNVTAAIPLALGEIADLQRAQTYLRCQRLGVRVKECPAQLLGLTPQKAKLKSFYPVEVLANRMNNYVRGKAGEAVVIDAEMTHSILGTGKKPQRFRAHVLRKNAYGLDSVPTLRASDAAADIMYNRMRQRDGLEDPTIEQIFDTLRGRLNWKPGDKGFSDLHELLEVVYKSTPRVQ